MNAMTEWLLAMLVAAAPPERAATEEAFPGWAETAEERKARYQAIADDAHAVVFDKATRPLFGGPHGRARTGALLLAVAYHESGLKKDVDVGPCYRGKSGKSTRCDSGRSACLMQIKVADGKTPEGWTQADLFADRKKCFRAGLRLLRSSMGLCKHLPLKHRLAAYASGSCEKGHAGSEALITLAERFMTVSRVPGPDANFTRE